MKGIVVDMHMNEANGEFNFTMNKPFANFDELKTVNAQLDGAMSMAEAMGKQSETSPSRPKSQMDGLMKSDPVVYSFGNNTFKRFQPKKEEKIDDVDGEETETDDMTAMFKSQFEEMFEAAFYTMTYTFPKRIKSVSNKEAVISADRKTMTLKSNLNAIEKDDTLMDLEVVLED